MSVKRPKRRNYESEPDFLLACLRYLDAKYPGREGQRKRLATWRRWEIERDSEPDVESLRARLSELIESDDWTEADADEFAQLSIEWREWRRTTDPRHTKKEKKK